MIYSPWNRKLFVALLMLLPASIVYAPNAIARNIISPLPTLAQEPMPLGDISEEDAVSLDEFPIIEDLERFQGALPIGTRLAHPKFQNEDNDNAVHLFGFTNQELTEAFKQNPDLIRSIEIGTFDGSYWEESLPFLFGVEGVCLETSEEYIETGGNCTLTAPARRWVVSQVNSMTYGLCEGIAAALLYLWEAASDDESNINLLTAIPEFFDPAAQTISDLSSQNSKLQEFVTSLFLTQTVAQVKEEAQFNRENLTPNDVLQVVIDSFWQDAVDPISLGIYRRDGDNRLVDGHTLVPTGVVQTEPGIYRVTVYDSNRSPEETHTVIFNQNDNLWSYDAKGLGNAVDIYRGDANSKTLDLNSLRDRDLGNEEYYECPFCGESDGIEIHLEGTNKLLVSQADGSPVPDSSSFVPQGGLGFDVPPVYSLPDGQYKVEVTGNNFSDFNYVTIFGQNFVAEIELPPIANGETVTLLVSSDETGPTLVLESEREHQEPAAVYIALDATEKDDNSYGFELSDIELTPGKSTIIQIDAQQYLLFGDNDRSEDTYSLSVESYGLEYLDEATGDFIQDGGFAIDFDDGITLGSQGIAVFDFGEYGDTGLLNYNEPENGVDETQNNFLPLYVLADPAISQPNSQAMLSTFAGESPMLSKPADAEPVKNGWRRRRPRMAQRRSSGRRRRAI